MKILRRHWFIFDDWYGFIRLDLLERFSLFVFIQMTETIIFNNKKINKKKEIQKKKIQQKKPNNKLKK